MTKPARLPAGADANVFGQPLTWWVWASHRFGRLPTRSELWPGDLGSSSLPYFGLIEILEKAEDFRFVLMGSAHCRFNLKDLQGVSFSKIYAGNLAVFQYVRRLYEEMIHTRRPVWSVNEYSPVANRPPVRVSRLMLPMSSEGETVDLCGAIQTFHLEDDSDPKLLNSWHLATEVKEIERLTL